MRVVGTEAGRVRSYAAAPLAIAIVLILWLLVSGQERAAAYHGHKVYVADHAATATVKYRPHRLWLTGDSALYVTKLHWKHYGQSVTYGSGIGHQNDCTPDCASGHYHKAKIRLRLSAPKRVCGRYVYTHVRVTWVHKPIQSVPKSFRNDPARVC